MVPSAAITVTHPHPANARRREEHVPILPPMSCPYLFHPFFLLSQDYLYTYYKDRTRDTGEEIIKYCEEGVPRQLTDTFY
jgi:hypothetical protein